MSEYRAQEGDWDDLEVAAVNVSHLVLHVSDGNARHVAYTSGQTDAERIARALRLLDAMEQDEFTAAQHRAMRLQTLDATTTEPQP